MIKVTAFMLSPAGEPNGLIARLTSVLTKNIDVMNKPLLIVALSCLSLLFACAAPPNGREVAKQEREISNSVRNVPIKPSARPATRQQFDSLQVGRSIRTIHWTAPANIPSTQSLPVIVLLHGNSAYGNPVAEITESNGGFDAFAEQQGFIAIYPDAIGSWNDGKDSRSQLNDDVSFIIEAINFVAQQRKIDGRRVFIAGFSEGGMMALRVACEAPRGFAGVAVVAANMPRSMAKGCDNAIPMPAIFIFGEADPVINFGGGMFNPGGLSGDLLSTAATVNFWVNKNNAAFHSKRALPDLDPRDGTTTIVQNYQSRGRDMVQFYKVIGGGHTWPGGTQYAPQRSVGNVARDFSANQAIWDFFNAR